MTSFLFQLFPDNRWTGGQYSLFRFLLGAGSLAQLLSWPALALAPVFASAIFWVSVGLSALLAVGFFDRASAACLLAVELYLLSVGSAPGGEPLVLVGFLLLAHLWQPLMPYGSVACIGKTDPGSLWRMPQMVFVASWLLLIAVNFCYGLSELNHLARADVAAAIQTAPLMMLRWVSSFGLIVLPVLALSWRLRPLTWLGMLIVTLGLSVFEGALGLGPATLLLLLCFDPGWIKALKPGQTDRIFFDSECGLCDGAVRFVLAEDRAGTSFRFAPLDGEAIRKSIEPERRASLPDSVIVLTAEGELLVRSAAALYILRRLGGIWRLAAVAASVVPQTGLDCGYDRVAKVRKRLFGTKSGACPIMPKHLRDRFDW